MIAALSCTGLKKSFGDVHAVNGVDLELVRGECFGMLWVPMRYFREAKKQLRQNPA